MKFKVLIFTILLLHTFAAISQINNSVSETGDANPQSVLVEKGQTLADFMDLNSLKEQSTDLNPGIDPEGDYMLRSVFSTDGTKLFVVTGGTDNVTVYDFETSTPITVISGLVGYPLDIAVTDDYAIVACLGGIIYIVDLSDYSIVEQFAYSGPGQAVVVETSPDGEYAYVAFDVTDQLVKIDLVNVEIENTFLDFPIELITYAYSASGGRSYIKFSRFTVSPDGNHLIIGNNDNSVLFFNSLNGGIDYSIDNIPNCRTVGLSGDGLRTIALGYDWGTSELTAFQIDNSTHAITGQVLIDGYSLSTYEIGVDYTGDKVYCGVNNNSSALVRFQSSDFVAYSQNYTPFWIGVSPDHQYAVHGQNRFSIFDFENETFTDQYWGNSQAFGAVSPVGLKAAGYQPLSYEGVYFYDYTDVEDIVYKGKELAGYPPEGDTPYRIGITPDGTKAITINNISENITIIDLQTYTIDTIMDMGENCWDIVFTSDSQWAILGGYDQNSIKIIDLSNYELVTSVTTAQRPMMLQISPDDQFVYVGNLKSNSVSIVELDGVNSQLLTTIPTGVIGMTFAAFGVKSGVSIDPTGQFLLVAASFDDKVQIIDVAQQQIVADLPVGDFPLKIAFNASGDYAVVTNYFSDDFSVIHVDGASSSVVGTYSSGGEKPMRLAYNPLADEFGIVNYSTKTVVNVDAATGNINSTDSYASFGTPIQISYNDQGNPLVLTMGDSNIPSYIVKNKTEGTALPATPSFFSYCEETKVAAACMPGPDYVSVIEYELNTDPPIANFEADLTTIHVGDFVSFTDLSINNPDTWEWSFEGGTPATSDEQDPSVLYESDGVFDVSLIVSNDYGSDTKLMEDYITVEIIDFVDELGVNMELSVYPNPFIESLFVSFNAKPKSDINVAIFDLNGRMLMAYQISEQENEINMKNLDAGIYILKITNGDEQKVLKVSKE
ncbi:MAG: hypothetical protein B7C24_00200 [Bacteroidetes bacterium 4572_77]|nr:MAG: hypothetical protein B7C24_00200 [Bacteroidetes bacterium 4572_77]